MIKLIFLVLFFISSAQAQISNSTIDANVTNSTLAVTKSGTWNIDSIVNPISITGSVTVTGGLTDTQLRASPVPISGTVTANTGLTQPLTDTQLRASAVPVSLSSTTITGTVAVSGPLTDTQLRASAVPVSLASVPLATNAATDRTTAAAPYANRLSDGTAFYDARQIRALTSADVVSAAQSGTWNINNISGTVSLPTGAATSANQTTEIGILNTIATNTGAQSVDTIQSGTITALNGAVAINAQGGYTVSVNLSGTWVATLVAEGLMADGTTWVQLPFFVVQTVLPYPASLTATTNGQLIITGGGYTQIRIRASAFTSGTVNVALNASLAQQTVFSAQLGAWAVTSTPVPNNLGVTAVGTTGTAVTATLPAVASLFHYIDSIEITAYSTAARTGGATPITCTTTNFNGSLAITFATAAAIGTTDTRQFLNANRPIKSAVANTATTIVCPATTGVIWRINVVYSTGT